MDTPMRSKAAAAVAMKKKKGKQTPEAKFQFELNSCSKSKDLTTAISLYDDAVSNNTRITHHHFNTLLYLCSHAVAAEPSLKTLALEHGFRIFDRMIALGITPNEASIATVARLAAAKGDGGYAFELAKNVGKYNVAPRLRTYDPALFCFCESLDDDRAYEVEEHMNGVGVCLEEPELAALLKVSVKRGRGEKVYEYLHKLRSAVRCVRESTAAVIEEWFRSGEGREVGEVGLEIFTALGKLPDRQTHPNLHYWYLFISSFTPVVHQRWTGSAKPAETKKTEAAKKDDDFDPFADEAEVPAKKVEKPAAKPAVKAAKPKPIAKSIVVFDVKIYDQEVTNLDELAQRILAL